MGGEGVPGVLVLFSGDAMKFFGTESTYRRAGGALRTDTVSQGARWTDWLAHP